MDVQILFVFKVGHSVQKKTKLLTNCTHHWRCYVDGWSPKYPLSAFVKKVTFNLHDTFENPRQVIRQAPFAIEEDGFGNFRLQIEVTFLDWVTTFHYDLTLFDNNELHAYRTVRIEPGLYDLQRLTELGGIVIPRDNNPSDVHRVVQIIQSCQRIETLHPYSFFPNLETRMDGDLRSASSSSGSTTAKNVDSVHLSPNVSSPAVSNDGHPGPQFSTFDLVASRDRQTIAPPLQPLPQKHKKKLQLLHEAQLLLEHAQKQQCQWAARPTEVSSSQYTMVPLSPNIPSWKSSSPKNPVRPFSGEELPNAQGATRSPVVPGPVVASTPVKQERPSPSKRIVLKLSLRGTQPACSPKPVKKETSEERRERRRRKRDRKAEHQLKRSSPLLARQCDQSPDVSRCLIKRDDSPDLSTNSSAAQRQNRIPDQPSPCPSNDRMDVQAITNSQHSHSGLGSSRSSIPRVQQTVEVPVSDATPQHSKGPAVSPIRGSDPDPRLLRSSVERELFGSDDDDDDVPAPFTGTLNRSPGKCNSRSHLLLDVPDEEFDEALSRSLFSQCHDSTVADNPSVDLFGDETLPEPGILSSARHFDHHHRASPTNTDDTKPYDPCDWFAQNRFAEHSGMTSPRQPSEQSFSRRNENLQSTRKNDGTVGKRHVAPLNDVDARFEQRTTDEVLTDHTWPGAKHKEKKSKYNHRTTHKDEDGTKKRRPPLRASSPSPRKNPEQSRKHSCATSDEEVPSTKYWKADHNRRREDVVQRPPAKCKAQDSPDHEEFSGGTQPNMATKADKPVAPSEAHNKSATHPSTSLESSQMSSEQQENDSKAAPAANRKRSRPKPADSQTVGSRAISQTETSCRTADSKNPSNEGPSGARLLNELDVELSSLSSTSSATSPMSSYNSLLANSADGLQTTDSHSPKSVRESRPPLKSSNEQSNSKPNKKTVAKANTDSSHSSAISSNEPQLKPREPNRTGVTGANVTKYSNQQLELLFDRLLRLERPESATRMGDILLQYLTPQSSEIVTDGTDGSTKTKQQAVKLLNKRPCVLAFNLRRLPVECLEKLTELITEDELLASHHDSPQQQQQQQQPT